MNLRTRIALIVLAIILVCLFGSNNLQTTSADSRLAVLAATATPTRKPSPTPTRASSRPITSQPNNANQALRANQVKAPTANDIWTGNGPHGGNDGSIYALAIDSQISSTVYTGGYSGSLFKSIDGGSSWGGKIYVGTPIRTLAIDPQNPSMLYAGINNGGVFKSTNGGASWSAIDVGLSNNTDVYALAIDPKTPSTIYLGAYRSAFKTTNGGATWDAINSGLSNSNIILSLAIDPQTPSTIYTGTDIGMFKSTDGGANWNAIGLINISVLTLAIDPQNTSRVYAGTNGGGVYNSTDSGGNWSQSSTGLTDQIISALVIASQTPNTIYAGTMNSGVFQSIDSGANWNAINNGLTNTAVRALAIDPQTPTTVYAGTWGSGVFSLTQSVPNYFISGRVTDDSNNPASSVTITPSSGSSTTTDSSGYYTLTNVVTGTYTITPSKSGYTFAPITQTVTVATADVAGINFRMRTVPPADFLDIPVTYSNFANALKGNTGNNTAWLVNSWFDHQSPNYTTNQNLIRWDKCVVTGSELNQPGRGWYDGHNGIDFQQRRANDPVYPAYGGTVKEVNRTWKSGTCGAKGCGYGNYVLIDHGYGYAGLYAHLDPVNPLINVGTQLASSRAITVGIMGGTGGYETHLHFGVYYDANGNGIWEENYDAIRYTEAVDPFSYRLRQGCMGPATDPHPWGIPSRYLWRQDILPNNSVGSAGAILFNPVGNKIANIPAGALATSLTLQFGDASPVAASSTQLRTTGHSCLLQVLEWLGVSGQQPITRRPNSNFAQPVTLQVTYGTTETLHLNTSQMKIYYWDEVAGAWSALPTTIDTNLKTATAQTTTPGNFDLQAPLLCPADTLEIDDNYYAAKPVIDRTSVTHLFDIAQDEDWLKLDAVAGSKYQIWTSNLAAGVDTILQVYDMDGITSLASNDNSGGGKASRLIWQAPQTGTYFIRVSQGAGSAFGCSASYQLNVSQGFDSFFPLIKK